MSKSKEHGKAQQVPRKEGRANSFGDGGGKGGAKEACDGSSSERERDGREIGEGALRGDGIIGGILRQLLSDAEQRLTEARDCVTWYQREEDKVRTRIEQIQSLINQLESEPE